MARVQERPQAPLSAPSPSKRVRSTSPGHVKVSVTLPRDVVEKARRNVEANLAPSLSAYVAEALAAKVAADSEDEYLAWLNELNEKNGPPSEEDYAWAREALGLEAPAPEGHTPSSSTRVP